ncbi:hypothetical protein L211DRAFT_877792 [Terfezia boudieri ATCC MYA-4762]|uniref:Uncharacterized protein n=1 Tax=Terfezia boudieri ATCC MYA-4762 TaxID=1051890 RepID=A0A3N4M3M1_9PEZI|nr:hypothetical protein L211DRAFT_877792 [Terfezia boudieri ATCC MYA-4762]
MRSLLILKDLWDTMHEDIPPVVHAEQRGVWNKKQEDAHSLIHLSCERDQARLCANARTGIQAWEILSARYASNNITNVMRLEEAFGQARKSREQNMEQCIGQVSALATQLNSVGVEVSDNRIAHRILNGLGQEFMN